jgi:hypothetical protein
MAGLSDSLSAISRFPAENMLLNRRNLLGEWQDIEVRAGVPHAVIAEALPLHHGEQLGAVEAAAGEA